MGVDSKNCALVLSIVNFLKNETKGQVINKVIKKDNFPFKKMLYPNYNNAIFIYNYFIILFYSHYAI